MYKLFILILVPSLAKVYKYHLAYPIGQSTSITIAAQFEQQTNSKRMRCVCENHKIPTKVVPTFPCSIMSQWIIIMCDFEAEVRTLIVF